MSIARLPTCATLLIGLLVARSAAGDDEPVLPEHRLEILAGLGISIAGGSAYKGTGEGGFAEAEYVFRPHSAVSPRLYGGVLITFPNRNSCATPEFCDVESQIAFLGAKVRLMAPIPYVGPYLELGLGASVGNLRTLDGSMLDETSRGVTFHVPVALGLALGRQHDYDIGFSYLFHLDIKNVGGAVAFGFGFAVP
jgi:hypothetical protein